MQSFKHQIGICFQDEDEEAYPVQKAQSSCWDAPNGSEDVGGISNGESVPALI